MQYNRNNQKEDTLRLIRWLSEHPSIQRKLCDEGTESTPEECIETIEQLEKNSFYDMICILLMKNSHDIVIGGAIEKVIAEKMANEWERIGTEQMCRDIKEKIKEEIKIKELPGNKMF